MRSIVLCYNLKGTPRGRKIEKIIRMLNGEIRHVTVGEYGMALGKLAGVPLEGSGERTAADREISPENKNFPEEMLLLHMAGEEALELALQMMRREQAAVDLKAVLTPSNAGWTSWELHRELVREHQAFAAQRMK